MHSNTESPIFQIVLITIFYLDIETLNSMSPEAWYFPSWSVSKTWNLWSLIDKFNQWLFSRIRIFMLRKFQYMPLLLIYLGFQSLLCPQLQVSFRPPRSQWKHFWVLRILVVIITLSIPCDWLLIIKKCQEVFFNMKSSGFSNMGFPITTNLMSSSKVSI